MARFFFTLSGEHEALPVSEIEAILEAEGHSYTIVEKLDQVLRLRADPESLKAIQDRAALTRICALELFICKAEAGKIVESADRTSFDKVLSPKESFVVRVRRVKNHHPQIRRTALETELGRIILKKSEDTRVRLKGPDKSFIGVLTQGKFAFGVKMAEIVAKPFVERRPSRKPFFHPAAMQAKLARCMVNLARLKAGDLMVDPFCGTGSLLIEARLIGCRILGSDIKRKMAKGTIRNLASSGIDPEGILVADARNLPMKEFDSLVADPPYGRSASTLKRTTRQIVEEVLAEGARLLKKGQRICMAAPKSLQIGRIGRTHGYKHLESHFIYVHRSLTREIAVFEKV